VNHHIAHIAGRFALIVVVTVAARGRAPRYIGEPDLDFTWTDTPPLVMPSAVAVNTNRDVYVCDGVNNRVLRFDAAGQLLQEIRDVAGETLDQPLSVCVDSDDRLWIADTGHGRVLILEADGKAARTLTPGVEGRAQHHDLTDVAPAGDGQTVWCVDNDGHALLRVDTVTGRALRIGRHGAAVGQLDYPFMLVLGAGGDVFTTDVLNGRVAVFDASGQPVRSLGSYGLAAGQLYRPKGIAIDAESRGWVSDAVLGVIQVFAAQGRFLGVLRAGDGTPMRFHEPAGLAFDASGHRYVAESAADRVRRIRVRTDPDAPPESAPPATLVSPQPRACTACHLEWMSPLINGRGTELIDVPENPPDHPLVSRAAGCRTCHDGTVVDSRRRVWVEHGHQEGLAPPAGMAVPGDLPLVDGRVVCRTCHSAHTRGGSGNALKDAVFLRVERHPGELCAKCHPGFDAGPTEGMHPLGQVVPGVPDYAATEDPGLEVADMPTCLACHVAHGPRATHLLAINPATNDGCLVCHATINAAVFAVSARHVHGREPLLSAAQRAAVASLESAVGPRGELLCRSCHRVHHAPVAKNLLAFDPAAREGCVACHPTQRGVIGTPHDLSRSQPETPAGAALSRDGNGGPCGGCHWAHRDARPPRPTDQDRLGLCASCHGANDVLAAPGLGEANHPQADCTACHDPHEPLYAQFMKAPPTQVCVECHAESARVVGGPHDVVGGASRWPAPSIGAQDTCLACHRPHGDTPGDLWRGGLAAGVEPRDAACLACHSDAAPRTASPVALVHPEEWSSASLLDKPATAPEDPRIECRTCHDPHRSTAKLWRLEAGAKSQQLCLPCHDAMAHIDMIGHGSTFLAAAGFETDACRPCHRVHADPATVDFPLLWPRELCADDGGSPPDHISADDRCLCCHRDGGPAPAPRIATHPAAEMYNPELPGTPRHLPLFNADDVVDPSGKIRCHTCHLTHGRTEPIPLPEGLQVLGPRELRARVWHIRRFVTPNVCTTCHGADALRRFMYFHDPARRGGPIEVKQAMLRQ
jgi:predicted CXXCH cytochrome family protein